MRVHASSFSALLALVVAALLVLAGCDSGGGDGGDLGNETTVAFTSERGTVSEDDEDAYTLSIGIEDAGFKEVSVEVVFDPASTLSFEELSGFPEDGRTLTFSQSTNSGDSLSFSFSVEDDSETDEGPETAVFRLESADGATIGTPETFTLTVNDDETNLLTIAEARGEDDGERVTVSGVLTGVSGGTAYVQDESGPTGFSALTVEGGGLAGAVTDGDLSPGDRVLVTGTLGDANGVRQLTDAQFSLVEAGAGLPDPQTPGVNTLASDGEDYESELVRVDGFDIDGSGTFAAGGGDGNYDVTGADGGTITLRIPSNSFFENQPVPEGPADFTGFVGEFDGSYQLLAYEADDLTVTRQGVVTRTLASRAWIQYMNDDETQGLVVQDDGFAGDVESGDRIEASGTLVSMEGGAAMLGRGVSTEVVQEDAGVPEPQMLSIDALASDPEDYESELVSLEGLSIDGSGNFEADTNYPVAADGRFFSLRVPDSSFYVGQSIPSGAINFEGVVGRTDGRYRLLALEEGDAATPLSSALTIAEVRNQDLDESVSTTGVFTRIEGSNARIQDGSGPTGASGIVVRSDAIEQAVADGDIEQGDRLFVSGTLGAFNGLLQIGSPSYEVIEEDAGLPAPQQATVAQLTENGEDYESELVRVNELTVDPSSDADGDGVFNGGGGDGNYVATGPDGTEIVLRIPDDSYYAGEPIPDGPVTFIGVHGQFNGEGPGARGPDEGYQLLAIDEGALAEGDVPEVVLFEDFQDGPDDEEGELGQFMQYSVASSQDWEPGTGGNAPNLPFAIANNFNGDEPANDWLISPALNLDNFENEQLSFLNAKGYDDEGLDGPALQVLVSTGYDGEGNPEDFEWTDVTDQAQLATTADQTDGPFSPFIESGAIDLSGFEGSEVYVAFKYISTGTGDGPTEAQEIDNVLVEEAGASGGDGGNGEDGFPTPPNRPE